MVMHNAVKLVKTQDFQFMYGLPTHLQNSKEHVYLKQQTLSFTLQHKLLHCSFYYTVELLH